MSETPQADARQGGGGESGPTRPQNPPPLPPRPPGAPEQPSAWTLTAPPGGPGGSPRRGPGRGLVMGGAVALVVAVVVGVVVATSGGDGDETSAGAPPAASGAPSPRKAFSGVPGGCELVRPSTVEEIVPGGVCTPGLMDDKDLETLVTRMPAWKMEGFGGPYRTLRLSLSVGPGAESMYDMSKQTALKGIEGLRKVLGSRPVDGLGEEAIVVYSADTVNHGLTEAQVVVLEGNATLTAHFVYKPEDSLPTRQQAEDAVVAAARDALASLS